MLRYLIYFFFIVNEEIPLQMNSKPATSTGKFFNTQQYLQQNNSLNYNANAEKNNKIIKNEDDKQYQVNFEKIKKNLYENIVSNSKSRQYKIRGLISNNSQPTFQSNLCQTMKNPQMSSMNSKMISKAKERCIMLYEKGKIKNELNKMIFQKNYEVRAYKELEECTFQPRTNSTEFLKKRESITEYLRHNEDTFYQKNLYWKNLKNENLERARHTKIRKEGFSFKPSINLSKFSKKQVFDQKKNVSNDYVAKIYFNRLENARKEEQLKKKDFK